MLLIIANIDVINPGASSSSTLLSTIGTATDPLAIAISPNKKYLYVTNNGVTKVNAPHGMNTNGGVFMYAISQSSGSLISLGSMTTDGEEPRSIVVSPDSKYVFTGNWGTYYNISSAHSGQNIKVYSIGSDGKLTEVYTLDTSYFPSAMAINSSNNRLYVGADTDVNEPFVLAFPANVDVSTVNSSTVQLSLAGVVIPWSNQSGSW